MILLTWYSQWIELRFEARQRRLELIKREKELQQIENDYKYSIAESEKVCQSCETLRMQLALARDREQLLLEKLFPTNPVESVEVPKAINTTRHIPWQVRRQILEKEDRAVAEAKRKNDELLTAKLEKELRIPEIEAKGE